MITYNEKIRDQSEKKMYKAKLHDGEVEVMILDEIKENGFYIGTSLVIILDSLVPMLAEKRKIIASRQSDK